METTYTWLPHLEQSLPRQVHGYMISSYALVLEAWRRGIKVTFQYNNEKKTSPKYALTYGDRTHHFQGTCGDLTSDEALAITMNKKRLREHLLSANLPYPEGKVFSESVRDEDIINYANDIGYPIVIKPFQGVGRTGVMPGVANEEYLTKAIHLIRHEQGFKEVMIEKHIEGDDFRLFVVDDKVIAATKRLTANIVGDGTSTVKALIKQKNVERSKNPALITSTIKLDADLFYMLQKHNYQLDSIPLKDEVIPLKSVCHIARGGDPIDVTDDISPKVKEAAIAAHRAIPGLASSGIDLMVNPKTDEVYIIEVNVQPTIRAQLFPVAGVSQDIPKAIIDYYFPETKQISYAAHFHFDYERIWQGFKHDLQTTVTLPPYPSGDTELTLLIIKTTKNHAVFKQWIQDIALNIGVHGYVRSIADDSMVVLVGGEIDKMQTFKTIIREALDEDDSIRERPSKKAVTFGFFIEENTYQTQALRFKEQELAALEKERAACKEKYDELVNQPLWKLLKPFHNVKD